MSFINDYSNILNFVETKINVINTLSRTDAALVAGMAQLLNGRNNPPSNMAALLAYLQTQEIEVTTDSLVKEVTLLLGASMGSKNTVWRRAEFLADGDFTVPNNIAGDSVFITMWAGGGSGAVGYIVAGTINLFGASSGGFVTRETYACAAGDVIPVVVGLGGAGVSRNSGGITSGNDGEDSSFGTLTVKGGKKGNELLVTSVPKSSYGNCGLYLPTVTTSTGAFGTTADIILSAGSEAGYIGGANARAVNGAITAYAGGGAAGPAGNGEDAKALVDSPGGSFDAPNNSGAATGSAAVIYLSGGPKLVSSGNGGSGKVIVEWQEFA